MKGSPRSKAVKGRASSSPSSELRRGCEVALEERSGGVAVASEFEVGERADRLLVRQQRGQRRMLRIVGELAGAHEAVEELRQRVVQGLQEFVPLEVFRSGHERRSLASLRSGVDTSECGRVHQWLQRGAGTPFDLFEERDLLTLFAVELSGECGEQPFAEELASV